MSTNPYQSPQEPVKEAATFGIPVRSDGLHEYLLSARSAAGKKITERVEASSADAAVETLRKRGYTEVVLHTDDVGALFTQQGKHEPHVTAKDYIDYRDLHGYWRRVGFLARKIYVQTWKWHILSLLILLARRWMQLRWGVMDYGMIGLLLMPLALVLVLQLNNAALRYHKFLELVAWGRWAEVLEQARRLRGRLPEHELLWQQAKALAGLGRLSEAVELVAPLADHPNHPQWLYCSRLAEVYAFADKRDEHLAWNEKALALAPQNATLLLDQALSLLRFQIDLPRARQLLVQARSHALSDLLAPAADAVEGVLLLEEGKPDQARDKLVAGIDGLNRFRHASPQVPAMQDRFRAYLALSLAALGDRSAAEHQLRLAEPRLRALNRGDLLARCQSAVGSCEPKGNDVATQVSL